MSELPHFDDQGRARMVDVGQKPISYRVARASGQVSMKPTTLKRIREGQVQKGDVLALARVAGIMACKSTSQTIPLCHPLSLNSVDVSFDFTDETTITINARVDAHERTGVEMEALSCVSAAALTIYDMCKSVDRGMVISKIQLEEKSGGKSGHYLRTDNEG